MFILCYGMFCMDARLLLLEYVSEMTCFVLGGTNAKILQLDTNAVTIADYM